jgi:hypothetical protein
MAAENHRRTLKPSPHMLVINRWLVFTGAIVVLLALAVGSSLGADKRRLIHGNTPAAVARLHALGNFPATNRLHLAIALPPRNPAELDMLLKNLYDPASASYRHYLTPQQFAEKFGASKTDYQALIKFAQQHGLKVTGTHSNRLVLDVAGSVADIERTFQVQMHVYRHPKESRTFFAPATEPSVDANEPFQILSISGLNNYSVPQPASLHMMPANQPPGLPTEAGSGPGGSFRGLDFRAAYLPNSPLNGAGQSVALVEFDGYYSNDIAAYETACALPYATLMNVKVDGGVTNITSDGSAEVSLDIEMAVAMATNLTRVLVYEEPASVFNWPDLLSQIADDNLAAQISCSWFNPHSPGPDPASELIFMQMAAQGQSFFAASGDNDAFVGQVPFPDDSPNITMVGGTTLTTTSPLGPRVMETVWNSGGGKGTGGGISTFYPIPSWQQGINSFLTNRSSTLARNVPDVALTAANVWVKYGNGQSSAFVGTSCAAPLWAGFMALVNQQAVAAGKPVVGFINPAVYEVANESIYNSAFNDITTGNNTWSLSPNTFFAGPNYDLCTGLGTPNGTNLINALVNPDPLIVVSNAGFRAVSLPNGGFNLTTQSFYLTNAGASVLNWTLGNTSAWLNASSSGGTLAAGADDSVVVSLNTVASNLNVGTYPACLWFSNNTSGVAHYRFFTLTVKLSNSLLQNGDFETGDFSDWTLVGSPNTSMTVFNEVVGLNSLGDGSSPKFIHSGNFGAFLGDTNLASLSQTISTVPGQNYLLSFWLVNPQGGPGQQFSVNWNTNSATTNQIYSISSPGVLAWQNRMFVVSATDTNSTLQFRAENPPDGFGLDDVSVMAVFAPAFTTLPPTNLAVLAGSDVALNAAASGTAPLACQWLTNGVELANGAGVSGATTTNLMLTSVTTNSTANYFLVVTNAYGAITSSVTALTVVLPPAINGVTANPDGSVSLSLAGSPGVSYILLNTTNLASNVWQPVATNVFDVTGVWLFNDVTATNFAQCFYRLEYAP